MPALRRGRWAVVAASCGLLLIGPGCGRIGFDHFWGDVTGAGGSGGITPAPTGGVAAEPATAGAAGASWPDIHQPGTGVVAAANHTCALRSGVLDCWGANELGQLGLGAVGVDELLPVRVAGDRWAAIQAGSNSTCALRTDGRVFCWGDNTKGQLGQGDLMPRFDPVPVPLPAPTLQLSHFADHACTLLDDHRVFCWGNNFEGQLGQDDDPDAPPEPSPLQVGTANDWLSVAAGEGHTCGLRGPGELWCWGRNTVGQLGLGSATPQQTRAPQRTHAATDWTSVSAGSFVTCGIRASGAASCWGTNPAGGAIPGSPDPQLSPDATVPGVAGFSVARTSIFHSCGLDLGGHAYCWGRNEEGQIGVTQSLAEPVTELGPDPYVSIAVGRFHTCVMDTAQAVWCAGANDHGMLGVGDTDRRFALTPVPL